MSDEPAGYIKAIKIIDAAENYFNTSLHGTRALTRKQYGVPEPEKTDLEFFHETLRSIQLQQQE